MHGTYLIEVAHKKSVKDPLAAEIAGELKSFGAKAACKVATAKLYRVIGQLSPEERHRVGAELLADPVVEEAHEGSWAPATAAVKPSKNGGIVIDVWYKQGVTDAVGDSVLKGLKDMHLDEISDVRTGMRYRFVGLKDAKIAEKIALAYLLNPLIHERFIHAD